MHSTHERNIHHILIAIDESESSRRAVEYVGEMLNGLKAFSILLLHIINEPEDDCFASVQEKQDWVAEKKSAAARILESCKNILVNYGMDPGRLSVNIQVRLCASIGECILSEAASSLARTIVVGRKGVSRREEFLFGSVSNRIIHKAKDCTVWVVE